MQCQKVMNIPKINHPSSKVGMEREAKKERENSS